MEQEIRVHLQDEEGKYIEFNVTRDLDNRAEVEAFFQTVVGMKQNFGLTLVKLDWTKPEAVNRIFRRIPIKILLGI